MHDFANKNLPSTLLGRHSGPAEVQIRMEQLVFMCPIEALFMVRTL